MIKQIILFFAVSMLLASTATAQETTLTSDGNGGYYVCIPKKGSKTLSLDGSISSFKIYDDGGADGNHSNDCYGDLSLIVPENYKLVLTGTIHTIDSKSYYLQIRNYYSITDNSDYEKTDFYCKYYNIPFDIGIIHSTINKLGLLFSTTHEGVNYSGIDITVYVIPPNPTDYNVEINSVEGGTMTCSNNSPNRFDNVTLTAKPADGYLYAGVSVKDVNNNDVAVVTGNFCDNTASFNMPASDVIVTPIFTTATTAKDGLYINMPTTGIYSLAIPSTVSSFKLYDDGGQNGNFSNLSNCTLTFTAPEGYVMRLSGYYHFYENTNITIYDGASKYNQLFKNTKSDDAIPSNIYSTEQSMTFVFSCDSKYTDKGLYFTISLVKNDAYHDVIIDNNITNGKIVSDKVLAKLNDKVTLTVIPNEGYFWQSISISDDDGKIDVIQPDLSFGDFSYYSGNEIQFDMRSTDATVSATFISKNDLYVTLPLPTTGQTNIKIPVEFNTFNLSSSRKYSCNGYLLLTAPEGFLINIKGNIMINSRGDNYAIVYDGADNQAESKQYKFTATAGNVQGYDINFTSSGNSLLFYEYKEEFGTSTADAFNNVTATLIPNNYTISYCCIENATFVSDNPETYTIEDEITLVNPTKDDYTFLGWTYEGQTEPVKTVIIPKGSTGNKEFTANWKQELGALTLYFFGNRITAEIQGDFTNTSSEDKSLEISKPQPVDKVIFKRSFSAGIPATIMLPFKFTSNDEIGKFYTLESVAPENGVWTATMSEPIKDIQANTPYIFKAKNDITEANYLTFNNIELNSTSKINDNSDANDDWTLHGVYQKTMLDGDGKFNYGFAGGEADGISVGDFIRAGKGVWADPMRCYLTYKDGELTTKAATVLPDRIRVVFPDEVEEEPSNTEIITPVTEITTESGVKVWSFDGTLYIEAQPDMDYTIVDLSGRILKKGVTHSTHEEVTVNLSTGIVIVIINDKSFKLNY